MRPPVLGTDTAMLVEAAGRAFSALVSAVSRSTQTSVAWKLPVISVTDPRFKSAWNERVV